MADDNLPARREETYTPEPLPAVARPDTDSWAQQVGQIAKLSEHIAGTEFVPKALRGKPAAVAAAILYGREVGLPPMTALTQTHVIEGVPSMAAEAMRAMVLAAGHKLEFRTTTGARCLIAGQRRGSSSWTEVEWTIDMAKAAKLLGKDNWIKWPRRMLQARATSELCELLFPDVIHGFRSVEEVVDDGAEQPAEDQASTQVQRRSSTRKTTEQRRSGQRTGSPAKDPHDSTPDDEGTPAGPPLPGEPGFDQDPTQTGDEPGASESSPHQDAGAATTEGEAAAAPASDQEPDVDDAGPRRASKAQIQRLAATFNGFGIKDRQQRLSMLTVLTRREQAVESMNDLTVQEASAVIDTLARCENAEQLQELLRATGEASQDQP